MTALPRIGKSLNPFIDRLVVAQTTIGPQAADVAASRGYFAQFGLRFSTNAVTPSCASGPSMLQVITPVAST